MALRQAGFTLIEVLIAMAITVAIAGISFFTLSTVMDGVEVLRRASTETHELNRMWMLLGRDIRQFVARPVRDEFGNIQASLSGGELAENSLTFTRIGWHNPAYRPRSNLQRVRYVWEDETLWRENYRVLDRADDTEPTRVALVEDVVRFELAFLGPETELEFDEFDTEDWPTSWAVGPGSQAGVLAPQAVEVTLELQGLGEIKRLYEIPSP